MTTRPGCSAAMAWHTSIQTPERVPLRSPARFPAADTSWQGNPAVSTSTGSTADQSTTVMSPRFFTAGKRCARMAAAPSSLSATHASSPPSTSWTASPMPS